MIAGSAHRMRCVSSPALDYPIIRDRASVRSTDEELDESEFRNMPAAAPPVPSPTDGHPRLPNPASHTGTNRDLDVTAVGQRYIFRRRNRAIMMIVLLFELPRRFLLVG